MIRRSSRLSCPPRCSALLSIAALIRYVRQRSYLPFVLYRFGLAALVVFVLIRRA